MITALLIAAAAALLYADKLKAAWAKLDTRLPPLQAHHYLALVCLAAAAFVYSRPTADMSPEPTPSVRPAPLSLAGMFTGPTAAEDAAALAGLCGELANYVEADGMADKPRLTAGWQVADLRTAAREIRMAGVSIGARQPLARDAVAKYLEHPEILGKAGGPFAPGDRARWVTALRDVAAAAEAAVR